MDLVESEAHPRCRPAVGDVFGRLVVVSLPVSGGQVLSRDRWVCRCSCQAATPIEVLGSRLVHGGTRSCGCLRRDRRAVRLGEQRRRHAARVSWRAMLRRGGTEIDVTWRSSFEAFFAALGERPRDHVLSRRDLDGPYDVDNCFWEPRRAQVERVRARRWSTVHAAGWAGGATKHCSACGVEKPAADYYANVAAKTKLHTRCKACCDDARRSYYQRHGARRLLASAKNRALEHQLSFEITEADLLPLPTHCPVFQILLTFGRGSDGRRQESAYSVDRLDNARGYIPGNVAVISWLANRLKNDAKAWQLERVAAWMRAGAASHATAGATEGLLW